MTDLIDKLNPPRLQKRNRGAIFRAIGRVGDIASSDINKVSRAFFPYLCDSRMLKRHSAALGIPEFPGDTEDALRNRTATGSKWMEERGFRGQIYEILESIIPGRYDVFEAPLNSFRVGYSRIGVDKIGAGSFIAIKVRQLTQSDYDRLYAIFDDVLDPDIEIIIKPWITAEMENLTLDQIRLYGGSKWLATLYSDICYLEVRILPDDAFVIGSARVGYSVVYGPENPPKTMITCAADYLPAVTERTQSLLDESIEWEVIPNG